MSNTVEFWQHLTSLNVPIATAPPRGDDYDRPAGWQNLITDGNAARIATFEPGHAVLGVLGDQVAVVDVDTKNGGNIDRTRQLLDGIGCRIYAHISTPSGGAHFYVPGHPDLPSVSATSDRDGLEGHPGVEILSHGRNAYLPGTSRHKYGGAGYLIVSDDLGTLADGGDDDSAEALAGWVAAHRVNASSNDDTPVAPPWDGTPPDRRQQAYLDAALTNSIERLQRLEIGSRNSSLNATAYSLGRLVAGAGLDPQEAAEQLLEACKSNGLLAEDGHAQCLATIRSGLRAGAQRPRAVPDTIDLHSQAPTPLGQAPTPVTDEAGGVEGDDLDDAVRRRYPRTDFAALLATDRPPREWVWDGVIPAGASVSLVAPAGVGKSLLALALAFAVSRGDADLAGIPIPRRRRVLIADLENTEHDLAERAVALGITPDTAPALDHLIHLSLPPLPALDTAVGGAELAAVLDAYEIGEGDLLILDSTQRVIAGPENDSDTLRAFYLHTAVELKRRKVTVLRLDNSGKDAEKGARGTSSKRDDVDVELLMVRDVDRADLFRITPGKSRVPDVGQLLLERREDEDGRLLFSTGSDPFRSKVAEVVALMDRLEMPTEIGYRRAFEQLKEQGHGYPRRVVKAALESRRDPVDSSIREAVDNSGSPGPKGLGQGYPKFEQMYPGPNTDGPARSGPVHTSEKPRNDGHLPGPNPHGPASDHESGGAEGPAGPPETAPLGAVRAGSGRMRGHSNSGPDTPPTETRIVERSIAGEIVKVNLDTGEVVDP